MATRTIGDAERKRIAIPLIASTADTTKKDFDEALKSAVAQIKPKGKGGD